MVEIRRFWFSRNGYLGAVNRAEKSVFHSRLGESKGAIELQPILVRLAPLRHANASVICARSFACGEPLKGGQRSKIEERCQAAKERSGVLLLLLRVFGRSSCFLDQPLGFELPLS